MSSQNKTIMSSQNKTIMSSHSSNRSNKFCITQKCAAIFASIALISASCGGSNHSNRMSKDDIQFEEYLLNSEDFDLETIIGLVKENKVSNIEELEKRINSPDSGINNIDVDNDETIDYILVEEIREGSDYRLEFKAIPSSSPSPDKSELVASMNIKKSGEDINVSGGYPDYVAGHDTHHYHYSHHGMSFGEGMFLGWMLSSAMRPTYISAPMAYTGYRGRSVMTPSQRSSTRTSYRSTTKISPIKKQNKPTNYKASPSASKTKSKFSKGLLKSNPNDKVLKSKSGLSPSYKQRSSVKKKPATGFGAKSNTSKSNKSSFSKPNKSGWGNSSSSKSKSSGWGRSSSSSRSGGFSSGFRRRRKKRLVI